MTITVYSDPHLGRTLQAHTTVASRGRMAEAIYQTTLRAVQAADGKAVCLGDLFDKYQNSEAVILQGMRIAQGSSAIMAGNHDVTADIGKVGSLQLLHSLAPEAEERIYITEFGKAQCFLYHPAAGVHMVMVPHHTTDALFRQSLLDAEEWAEHHNTKPSKNYLCLHCNYDSGFATDETALSLTRKEAKALLAAGFDYILIGHDHHPREDLDGRVIIMGNMHPTGFGDITPKRVLRIGGDGSHTFLPVWEPEGKSVSVEVNQLLAGECVIPPAVEFIEIVGQVGPDKVLDLSRTVRSLWTDFSPFAIRNKVEIASLGADGAVSHDFASLDKIIRGELETKPELLELFNSYWAGTAPTIQEENDNA